MRNANNHASERDSRSPYDVSWLLAEISNTEGLLTNRQTLQALEALLAKVNPECGAFAVVLDATQSVQDVLIEVAA